MNNKKSLRACKGFRWMPGMSDGQCRVWEVQDVDAGAKQMLGIISIEGGMVDWCTQLAMGEPDTDDPATLGCLLALVREAVGRTVEVTIHDDGTVDLIALHPYADLLADADDGASLGVALVAALEIHSLWDNSSLADLGSAP